MILLLEDFVWCRGFMQQIEERSRVGSFESKCLSAAAVFEVKSPFECGKLGAVESAPVERWDVVIYEPVRRERAIRVLDALIPLRMAASRRIGESAEKPAKLKALILLKQSLRIPLTWRQSAAPPSVLAFQKEGAPE